MWWRRGFKEINDYIKDIDLYAHNVTIKKNIENERNHKIRKSRRKGK